MSRNEQTRKKFNEKNNILVIRFLCTGKRFKQKNAPQPGMRDKRRVVKMISGFSNGDLSPRYLAATEFNLETSKPFGVKSSLRCTLLHTKNRAASSP